MHSDCNGCSDSHIRRFLNFLDVLSDHLRARAGRRLLGRRLALGTTQQHTASSSTRAESSESGSRRERWSVALLLRRWRWWAHGVFFFFGGAAGLGLRDLDGLALAGVRRVAAMVAMC